jgi:hypothetical protein
MLTGASSNTDQVEAITAARAVRTYQGFVTTVVQTLVNGVNATTQFDGNLYWYKSAVSGNVTTISYFMDQGATVPVGTATATNTTVGGAATQTFSVVLAINNSVAASTRPESGTVLVTLAPSNTSFSINGTINLNSASGSIAEAIDLTATQTTVTGNITTTGGVSGANTSYTNVNGTVSNGVITLTTTGTVLTTTNTVNLTLNANGSGNLTLTDGTGLTWSSGGSGSLTLEGVNGNINVANVDDGE